jgi:hypothetical protein
MSNRKLKNKEIFIKKVLEISEEKEDFEIAKKEFSYWGQIKPKEEMKSPLFNNPNKTIKWGILFYNEKTNTPFVCSSKSQYYMREKTRVFKGIKQVSTGDGSSKKPINRFFINKMRRKFEKIMNKPFEEITANDVREMKMIKIILEEIELDLRDEDFNPFYTSVVKGYNQYIEWGLG